MIRRLLPHPALSLTVALVWLMLLNALSVGGVVMAALVGVVVPLVTSRFWPDRPRLRFGQAMAGFLALVLWDIVVANFQVAAIVLFRRSRDLRPGWIVIPLALRQPEAIAALAGVITLTPGTLSADVSGDGRALLVHALDVADPAAEAARIKQRYEARLMRIYT